MKKISSISISYFFAIIMIGCTIGEFLTIDKMTDVTVKAIYLDKTAEERHHKSRYYMQYFGTFRLVEQGTVITKQISKFNYDNGKFGEIFEIQLPRSTIENWSALQTLDAMKFIMGFILSSVLAIGFAFFHAVEGKD